jgi:hypothetical protein
MDGAKTGSGGQVSEHLAHAELVTQRPGGPLRLGQLREVGRQGASLDVNQRPGAGRGLTVAPLRQI